MLQPLSRLYDAFRDTSISKVDSEGYLDLLSKQYGFVRPDSSYSAIAWKRALKELAHGPRGTRGVLFRTLRGVFGNFEITQDLILKSGVSNSNKLMAPNHGTFPESYVGKLIEVQDPARATNNRLVLVIGRGTTAVENDTLLLCPVSTDDWSASWWTSYSGNKAYTGLVIPFRIFELTPGPYPSLPNGSDFFTYGHGTKTNDKFNIKAKNVCKPCVVEVGVGTSLAAHVPATYLVHPTVPHSDSSYSGADNVTPSTGDPTAGSSAKEAALDLIQTEKYEFEKGGKPEATVSSKRPFPSGNETGTGATDEPFGGHVQHDAVGQVDPASIKSAGLSVSASVLDSGGTGTNDGDRVTASNNSFFFSVEREVTDPPANTPSALKPLGEEGFDIFIDVDVGGAGTLIEVRAVSVGNGYPTVASSTNFEWYSGLSKSLYAAHLAGALNNIQGVSASATGTEVFMRITKPFAGLNTSHITYYTDLNVLKKPINMFDGTFIAFGDYLSGDGKPDGHVINAETNQGPYPIYLEGNTLSKSLTKTIDDTLASGIELRLIVLSDGVI